MTAGTQGNFVKEPNSIELQNCIIDLKIKLLQKRPPVIPEQKLLRNYFSDQ